MAISREDKADVKGAMGKALANKVDKVTNDGSTKLSRNTARLRAEGKLYKSQGMAPDSPLQLVTHIGKKKIR